MALASLADHTDLLDRGITVPTGANESRILDAASAAIRDAAGSAITAATATVTYMGSGDGWLDLGVQPVREVTAVAIDAVEVDDYRLIGGRLWRSEGWRASCWEPSVVEVTMMTGLDTAPADIIDLCCSLAAAAFASVEDGYDPGRGLTSLGIDDYRESYARGDEEVVNPLELPERTRTWLRGRFGSPAFVIETY